MGCLASCRAARSNGTGARCFTSSRDFSVSASRRSIACSLGCHRSRHRRVRRSRSRRLPPLSCVPFRAAPLDRQIERAAAHRALEVGFLRFTGADVRPGQSADCGPASGRALFRAARRTYRRPFGPQTEPLLPVRRSALVHVDRPARVQRHSAVHAIAGIRKGHEACVRDISAAVPAAPEVSLLDPLQRGINFCQEVLLVLQQGSPSSWEATALPTSPKWIGVFDRSPAASPPVVWRGLLLGRTGSGSDSVGQFLQPGTKLHCFTPSHGTLPHRAGIGGSLLPPNRGGATRGLHYSCRAEHPHSRRLTGGVLTRNDRRIPGRTTRSAHSVGDRAWDWNPVRHTALCVSGTLRLSRSRRLGHCWFHFSTRHYWSDTGSNSWDGRTEAPGIGLAHCSE